MLSMNTKEKGGERDARLVWCTFGMDRKVASIIRMLIYYIKKDNQ